MMALADEIEVDAWPSVNGVRVQPEIFEALGSSPDAAIVPEEIISLAHDVNRDPIRTGRSRRFGPPTSACEVVGSIETADGSKEVFANVTFFSADMRIADAE